MAGEGIQGTFDNLQWGLGSGGGAGAQFNVKPTIAVTVEILTRWSFDTSFLSGSETIISLVFLIFKMGIVGTVIFSPLICGMFKELN